jgi:hypothetical protein
MPHEGGEVKNQFSHTQFDVPSKVRKKRHGL